MKIGIMGTPVSSGNRGVLALGASLVNLCCQVSDKNEVILLLGNKDKRPAQFRVGLKPRLIPVVNCRMSPRSRPTDHFLWILVMSIVYALMPVPALRKAIVRSTPWIRTISETDMVGDVRGGDSFSDIYGFKNFFMGFLMAWTVLLIKGSIVHFPQTYGPYKSPIARWLARFLLKNSTVIIARDKTSQKVAQELIGPGRRVYLSPDVAFSLLPVPPDKMELNPPLTGPFPVNVIGLNVNGLMYNGGYSRQNMFGLKMNYANFLPEMVVALLAEHPGELWLVPHTYAPHGNVESDNEASQKLRDQLPGSLRHRVRVVSAEYDQHEIKWIIGKCDFFIGSRMHSCIAALSQGVPCVGVAYSRKFAGVFESIAAEEWVVEGREVSDEEAIARIVELYRKRDDVRSDLINRSESARRQLTEIFQRLIDQRILVQEVSLAL
jgi:colanic acid/amylovoran biosynthesis protein